MHFSPCNLSRRSAARGLGPAHQPDEFGQGAAPRPSLATPMASGHALLGLLLFPVSQVPAPDPAPLAPPAWSFVPPGTRHLLSFSSSFPPAPFLVLLVATPGLLPPPTPRPTLCRLTAEEEDGARVLAPQVALVTPNAQPHHQTHDAAAHRQHHACPCHRQHGWGGQASSTPLAPLVATTPTHRVEAGSRVRGLDADLEVTP